MPSTANDDPSGATASFAAYFETLSMYALIALGALISLDVLCLLGGLDKENEVLIRQLLRTDNTHSGRTDAG